MKIYQILLILLICVVSINAKSYLPETTNNIVTIDYCYGDIDLIVRGRINVSNLHFEFCEYNGSNMWVCECNKPSPIIFTSKPNTSGEFNVALQYYIKDYSNDIKNKADYLRTTQVTDIIIYTPKDEVKKQTINFDSINFNYIWLIVIIILVVVIGMIVLIIKVFFPKDDKPKKIYSDEKTIEWMKTLK